jgi:hypothetical protein
MRAKESKKTRKPIGSREQTETSAATTSIADVVAAAKIEEVQSSPHSPSPAKHHHHHHGHHHHHKHDAHPHEPGSGPQALWVKRREQDSLLGVVLGSFGFFGCYMVLEDTRLSWYDNEENVGKGECSGYFDFANLTQGYYELVRNANHTTTIITPNEFNNCDLKENRLHKHHHEFEQFCDDIEAAMERGREIYHEDLEKRRAEALAAEEAQEEGSEVDEPTVEVIEPK